MGVLQELNPNLVDAVKRTAPDGSIETDIVELLNQANGGVFSYLSAIEANGLTSHRTTVRTGLPSSTWRKFYGGIPQSKSKTQQVDESMGMLRAKSDIDYELFQLNGMSNAFRLTEDMAFIEQMGQEALGAIFGADESVTPEKFNGLAARFPKIGTPNGTTIPETALNVISAGGATADVQSSIWLIVSSPRTIATLFPKGSRAGLVIEAETEPRWLKDPAGDEYKGLTSYYKWDLGLTVRDWRYAVRICNIEKAILDVGDATAVTLQKKLVTLMTQATERVQDLTAGRPMFVMPRRIRENLRMGAIEKAINQITLETVAGMPMTMFAGIPIFRCDVLGHTEAVIS